MKEFLALFLCFAVYVLNISMINAFIFFFFYLLFFISPCFILAVSVFFRSFVTGLKLK